MNLIPPPPSPPPLIFNRAYRVDAGRKTGLHGFFIEIPGIFLAWQVPSERGRLAIERKWESEQRRMAQSFSGRSSFTVVDISYRVCATVYPLRRPAHYLIPPILFMQRYNVPFLPPCVQFIWVKSVVSRPARDIRPTINSYFRFFFRFRFDSFFEKKKNLKN